MPLVYDFKIIETEYLDESDIYILFQKKAPMKIRTGSGNFRIFIRRLELHDDGLSFTGKAGTTEVEGVLDPSLRNGVIIFLKEAEYSSVAKYLNRSKAR